MKLQTNKEQLSITRKQCDTTEENVQVLETRTTEIIIQLDATKAQSAQLAQEKDVLQKTLDSLRSDKNILEKNKIEMSHTVFNYLMFIFNIHLRML